MSKWIPSDAIPQGEGRCFEVEGEHVAVVNIEGTYYGMQGSCPCAQREKDKKNLSEIFESCPNREWSFDMVDGPCLFKPDHVETLHTVDTQRRFWEAGSDADVQVEGPPAQPS